MKKTAIFAILCTFCLSCILSACTPPQLQISCPDTIKNVIVLIGDGMSFNHIANAKTFFGVDSFCFEKDFVCEVETFSANNKVTDSAAAATALATGTKVNNKNVSRFKGKDLKSIMTIAQEHNKKTGIITSDKLYGATPACFSSHANSRSDTQDIIDGQLTSGIDILIGEKSGTYQNRKEDFENNGYQFASSLEELLSYNSNQKTIGNLNGLRSSYNTSLENQLDFNLIVNHTLNALDNENGFCLMIENAYIDKCSHNNDAYGAVCEVRSFADTIQTVYEFCKDRNDTIIIVTADHETGGFALANNKSEISNTLYTIGSHTAANVPLYMKGCTISNFKNSIDNTNIFNICKKAMAQ